MSEALRKIANVIPLLGVSLLIIVVFHEIAYFMVIDINLINLINIGDYIVNSFNWIPVISISFIIIAVIAAYVSNVTRDPSRKSMIIMGFSFLVFTLILFLLIPRNSTGELILLCGISIFLTSLLYRTENIYYGIDKYILTTVVSLSILCVFSSSYGILRAKDLLNSDKADYIIGSYQNKVQFIRSINRGLLVRDPKTKKIMLVNTNGEIVFSVFVENYSNKNLLCLKLNRACNFDSFFFRTRERVSTFLASLLDFFVANDQTEHNE